MGARIFHHLHYIESITRTKVNSTRHKHSLGFSINKSVDKSLKLANSATKALKVYRRPLVKDQINIKSSSGKKKMKQKSVDYEAYERKSLNSKFGTQATLPQIGESGSSNTQKLRYSYNSGILFSIIYIYIYIYSTRRKKWAGGEPKSSIYLFNTPGER